MAPVYYPQPHMIGVTLTSKSIDAKIISQIALKEVKETLEAIIEDSNLSVILLDLDYRIISLNSLAAKKIEQYSNHIPNIGDDFRLFFKNELAVVTSLFELALQGKNSSKEIEFKNTNSESIWYKTGVNPVYKKNKSLLGVSIFASEITELKNLEIKLKDCEDQFYTLKSIKKID
jgi:PAS domain S-box-containing protein